MLICALQQEELAQFLAVLQILAECASYFDLNEKLEAKTSPLPRQKQP